jgi:hypothetical protein
MYDSLIHHLLKHKFFRNEHREKVGWFHCTIYSYIGIVLHQIPVLDPSYDCYGFVYHTRWGGAKDKFIQGGKEVFVYSLILCSVVLLPKHFVVYVDCDVCGKPTPPYVWVPMDSTHYVSEI